MTVIGRLAISCLMLAALLGCARDPVRHLASDASLITPGVSTRSDVLTYLGDPDERLGEKGASEQWVYREEYRSAVQKTLDVAGWLGPESVSRIIVTFDGELVTDIRYNRSESGEFGQ